MKERRALTFRLKKNSGVLLLLLCVSQLCYAGITGTLSGTITDKDAGTVLPGAAILVEGTTIGAMADKNGRYVIYNLPAGSYDVSITMIGYSRMTVKNVTINVDLNTPLNVELSAKVLPLKEVVVTEQKRLIQPEVTSSTYFISGAEISDRLPIDSYLDAISLLPGVVGNHIRGGRETDVLYLLDGLPVQSSFSRQISADFPNNSIAEMMVQTGGFSAEYGHATSGIVNIVSKDGRNKVSGGARIYSDFAQTALADNDNSRRIEFNVGGPLTLGLGGPLINANYLVAADFNLSDTAHRRELRNAVDSPVFSNYNINSKLSLDLSSNTLLTLQGLVSNWQWRQFDEQWKLNPQGLAQSKHYSHRLSASLTHTFSSKFFASLRYGFYSTKREILGTAGDTPPELIFQDPQDATSPVLSGDQPRREDTRERLHIVKLDLVGQLADHHIVKTGIEAQSYRVRSQATIYEPVTQKGNVNAIIFNRTNENYDRSPGTFALYVNDKISFRKVVANLGLRYDVLSPDIQLEQIPDAFSQLQRTLRAPSSRGSSQQYTRISPRLGVSLPLSNDERLHLNYGWYYQLPPLYYYYTNSAANPRDTYLPRVGNVDLEPTKTISTEFSYKRVVSDGLLFVFSGFAKRFENLVDTRMFILPDSLRDTGASNIGFTQYVNAGSAKATGFEVTLQKRIIPSLTARLSYSYMKASGNSTDAESGHERALSERPLKQGATFPLSWDQRHSVIFNADYAGTGLSFNLLYRIFSPLPVSTDLSQPPNARRLHWRHLIDMRAYWKSDHLMRGHLRPFAEVRNLLDQDNLLQEANASLGIGAYRLFDPIKSDTGRRLRIGLSLDF